MTKGLLKLLGRLLKSIEESEIKYPKCEGTNYMVVYKEFSILHFPSP
jgi:hypothetical protein